MRTIITLNGKRISKKAAYKIFGKEEIDRKLREAKQSFIEDPLAEISWWVGTGMLEISFQ